MDDHHRRNGGATAVTPDPDKLPARWHGQPQPQATRALLREAYRTVFAFFRRRVADEHTAHDLTQNTFLRFRIWQEGNPGRMPDKLEAFLLQQAEWVRRDHFRKVDRTHAVEALSGGPADLAVMEDGRLLAAAAPSALSASVVLTRVDIECAATLLSDAKRLALVLRFVDGLPTSQIAEVLAVGPRRVNQLIREALDELANSESLAGYGSQKGGHQ